MNIACTNINNKGIILSKELINKVVFKYNGMLGRALYKLYDMGYQSSPAIFNPIDFRSILFSDFSYDIYLLRDNLRGKIDLSDELMIKYAILKTDNEAFRDILSIYLDILVAKKALDSYNTLLSKVKLPKKNDLVKVKSRLGVSGSVKNYNTLPLDVPAIRESFYVGDDEELVHFDTSDIMVKEIIKRLGYSEDDYLEHKKSGQPFFISGVSQDDEVYLMPIIISGKIVADGKFGKELINDIQKYYNDFYETHTSKVHCLNYEEVIFNSALVERISLIKEKRANFVDKPFRDFYATTNEVIFAVKVDKEKEVRSYFRGNKLKLGVATLSHENRCEFSKINTLSGLCGEFIHENDVRDKGWVAKGLPVPIKFGVVSGKKLKISELNYYPIYNVYYSDDVNSSNVEPLLGNDIHITVSDINEVFKHLGVLDKAELFNKFLKETYVSLPSSDINRASYEQLVADLATALVYAECGYLDYDMYGTGYSWVTDEIFYKASTEAEELFKSFGF